MRLTKSPALYVVETKPLVALRFLLLKKKLKICLSERMNNKYSEMKFIYLKYFSLYLLFICTSFDVIQFIFGTSANEKHITFTEIIFQQTHIHIRRDEKTWKTIFNWNFMAKFPYKRGKNWKQKRKLMYTKWFYWFSYGQWKQSRIFLKLVWIFLFSVRWLLFDLVFQ